MTTLVPPAIAMVVLPRCCPPNRRRQAGNRRLRRRARSFSNHRLQAGRRRVHPRARGRHGIQVQARKRRGHALHLDGVGSAALRDAQVPDGAPKEFAETFDKQDDRMSDHGTYTAPFPGIHGWYWQNKTGQPVTFKMTTTGFYSESQEFRKGQPVRRKPF